jgi:hypothetical protein
VEGRRRPDETPIYELEPGDYCLYKGEPWVVAPNGAGPVRCGAWDPVWHEDGTLTLTPSLNIHESNVNPGWHGFLERGVWTA